MQNNFYVKKHTHKISGNYLTGTELKYCWIVCIFNIHFVVFQTHTDQLLKHKAFCQDTLLQCSPWTKTPIFCSKLDLGVPKLPWAWRQSRKCSWLGSKKCSWHVDTVTSWDSATQSARSLLSLLAHVPQNFSQSTYTLRKKGTGEREQKMLYKKNNFSLEFQNKPTLLFLFRENVKN